MKRAELENLREIWRVRIEDFRASGQTGAAWCAANQIKEHQLWYWVRKFATDSSPESQPRFIPVQVQEPTKNTDPSLLVRVGSVVIEVKSGYDSNLLCDVVRTLASLC